MGSRECVGNNAARLRGHGHLQAALVDETFVVSASEVDQVTLDVLMADLAPRGVHCVVITETNAQSGFVQAFVCARASRLEAALGGGLANASHGDDARARWAAAGWNPAGDDDVHPTDARVDYWADVEGTDHLHRAAGSMAGAVAIVFRSLGTVPGDLRLEVFPADDQFWHCQGNELRPFRCTGSSARQL